MQLAKQQEFDPLLSVRTQVRGGKGNTETPAKAQRGFLLNNF